MRIPIDPGGEADSFFSGLLRLQTDFYTRLTDETLQYIRRLQGAVAPATPGTVLKPDSRVELKASGSPGTSVRLKVEFENRQRVHCIVTPMLSPLVDASGVTWFPAADSLPPFLLIAPEEIATIVLKLPLPANIPYGSFHGALLLLGIRGGAVPVTITIMGAKQDAAVAETKTRSVPKPPRVRKATEKKSTAPKRSPRTARRQP